MKLKKIFRSILLLSVGILMVQCKKDEPELEPAVISFVSETLDFESVEVGKFNDEKLVMSNLGGQDLEIKAIDIVNKDLSKNTTPEFLVKGNIKITIKPKEKAEVIITFKPVSEGMKAGMLNLKTNIGEFKIDLKGKATPAPKAIFNITPKSHDFGDVILGKDAEKELKVKNIGNADLILKTVTMKNSSGQEQNFTVNNLANVKVKPNKTAGIIINFKPKSKGSKSGVLKITTNVGNFEVAVKGKAKPAPKAVFNITPKSHDFGDIILGKDAKKELKVKNTGNADLILKTVTMKNSSEQEQNFTVNNLANVKVKPNKTAGIIINFKPKSKGSKSGVLKITTNVGNFEVAVKGKAKPAPKAIFNITPKSHDFGDIILGKDAKKELKVKNTGNADLILKTVTMKNSSEQEQNFTVNNLANVEVNPNKTAGIIINFKPKSKGSKSGVLKITTNVGNFEVAVKGNSISKAIFSIEPKSYDFGDVEVESLASSYLKVTNTGTEDLILQDFTIEGSSQFGYDPIGSTTIKPDKEGSIYVDFHPKTKGKDTCVLKIKTNVGEFKVNLKGNGVLPKAIFNIEPESYDFGDVKVGIGAETELEVKNTGKADLIIETVTIEDPTGAVSFSVNNYNNVVVKPNEKAGIIINFNPQKTGNKSAKLKIKTNVGEFTVNLKGNGVLQ